MKTVAAVLAAVALTVGCATAYTYRLADAPEYGAVPKDSVAVYASTDSLPCQKFDKIARLEGSGSWPAGKGTIVSRMRSAAAKAGADAVLLEGYDSTNMFKASFTAHTESKARALAIRLHCGGAQGSPQESASRP